AGRPPAAGRRAGGLPAGRFPQPRAADHPLGAAVRPPDRLPATPDRHAVAEQLADRLAADERPADRPPAERLREPGASAERPSAAAERPPDRPPADERLAGRRAAERPAHAVAVPDAGPAAGHPDEAVPHDATARPPLTHRA